MLITISCYQFKWDLCYTGFFDRLALNSRALL
uniref:Uncharacterized protein n=1 Tax=Rhizophora mucronata TaxID=61149 RepID=A0A2P2N8A9_RHIMU